MPGERVTVEIDLQVRLAHHPVGDDGGRLDSGTFLRCRSISSATWSIVSRSGPFTLTPIGARIPDWSMTRRAAIG